MKPGPAISQRSKKVADRSRLSQTASAILRGALLKARADTMAALEAKSPWEVSAGISMVNGGTSPWGSSPFCMAAWKAVVKSCLACDSATAIRFAMFDIPPLWESGVQPEGYPVNYAFSSFS